MDHGPDRLGHPHGEAATGMTDSFTMRWVMIQNDFPRIIASMVPTADMIVAKAAHDIEAQAKVNVHQVKAIDTGTMLNSIQATKIGTAHWRVVVGVDYGVHVEWGTRFMAARPFFRPAINTVQPTFLEAMRRVAA